jgi:catechol 2,3-dioxygenase-like lactoylglutathione lyase family enzyme
MEISVGVLDHYNVSTRKLKETVQFYEDVLGFVNGARPQFDFPGAWLSLGVPGQRGPTTLQGLLAQLSRRVVPETG